MEKEFILKLAQKRAEELFTTDFFHHVTDSWYFDEKLRFEHSRVDLENSHPTKDDVDIYMKYLDDLFREYENKLYSYKLWALSNYKMYDTLPCVYQIEFPDYAPLFPVP